jgi:hypothetical protein
MAGTSNPNFSEMDIQVLFDEVGKKIIFNISKAGKCCHKQQNIESLGDHFMVCLFVFLF